MCGVWRGENAAWNRILVSLPPFRSLDAEPTPLLDVEPSGGQFVEPPRD